MLALAGVAFGDPAHWIAYTAAFSVALGIAGATQDVTIDSWRITSVPVAKQSVMTAISEMGYRVGALAAGAGTLLLADKYGWRFAYLGMAALMTVGVVSAFVAPEPESDFTATHKHPGFAATVIAPIKEMVGRLGPLALPILVMVAGFRMPGYLSTAMSMPLFKSLDYSDTEIATVTNPRPAQPRELVSFNPHVDLTARRHLDRVQSDRDRQLLSADRVRLIAHQSEPDELALTARLSLSFLPRGPAVRVRHRQPMKSIS